MGVTLGCVRLHFYIVRVEKRGAACMYLKRLLTFCSINPPQSMSKENDEFFFFLMSEIIIKYNTNIVASLQKYEVCYHSRTRLGIIFQD